MIPKAHTVETDLALEEAILAEGAFEKIVRCHAAHLLGAAKAIPPAGTLFTVELPFATGGCPWLLPARTVKFYAVAKVDSASPKGVAVPDAGEQAARAAAELRRVRLSILN